MRKQTQRYGWTKKMQRGIHNVAQLMKAGRHQVAQDLRAHIYNAWKAVCDAGDRTRKACAWQPNNCKDANGRTLRWQNNELVPRFAS